MRLMTNRYTNRRSLLYKSLYAAVTTDRQTDRQSDRQHLTAELKAEKTSLPVGGRVVVARVVHGSRVTRRLLREVDWFTLQRQQRVNCRVTTNTEVKGHRIID